MYAGLQFVICFLTSRPLVTPSKDEYACSRQAEICETKPIVVERKKAFIYMLQKNAFSRRTAAKTCTACGRSS